MFVLYLDNHLIIYQVNGIINVKYNEKDWPYLVLRCFFYLLSDWASSSGSSIFLCCVVLCFFRSFRRIAFAYQLFILKKSFSSFREKLISRTTLRSFFYCRSIWWQWSFRCGQFSWSLPSFVNCLWWSASIWKFFDSVADPINFCVFLTGDLPLAFFLG